MFCFTPLRQTAQNFALFFSVTNVVFSSLSEGLFREFVAAVQGRHPDKVPKKKNPREDPTGKKERNVRRESEKSENYGAPRPPSPSSAPPPSKPPTLRAHQNPQGAHPRPTFLGLGTHLPHFSFFSFFTHFSFLFFLCIFLNVFFDFSLFLSFFVHFLFLPFFENHVCFFLIVLKHFLSCFLLLLLLLLLLFDFLIFSSLEDGANPYSKLVSSLWRRRRGNCLPSNPTPSLQTVVDGSTKSCTTTAYR